MDKERLPIKFFAKREVDNLRVEAGGSGDLPKWVLDERTLARKSESFVNTVEAFKNEVIKKESSNSIIPLVFKTKIVDDATAKTHRKEVSNLFKTGAQNNVLGLAEADEIIIKLEGSKETDTIIERLKDTDKFAYALSCIDSIVEFKPMIAKSEKDEGEDYKVKLINFQNYEQNTSIRKYFEKSVTSLGLQVEKTNYTPDHIIYNIKSVTQDALQMINNDEAFEAVYSIEPMPKYKVALDMGLEDDMSVDILWKRERTMIPSGFWITE